jgi:ADP-dependent NAD(P)H-hydrate dehydratase / NAD(P)H-hydrate epimerase
MQKYFHPKTQLKVEKRALIYKEHDQLVDLCEEAGLLCWKFARKQWPSSTRWSILIGKGHNGADGLAFAYHAHLAGHKAQIFLLETPQNSAELTIYMLEKAKQINCTFLSFCEKDIQNSDVIVDAMLGIGINRPLSGLSLEAALMINQSKLQVFSIDCPSGLDAYTGSSKGACVKAEHTLCLMLRKPGLHMGQGKELSGKVHFRSLISAAKLLKDNDPIEAISWDKNTITRNLVAREQHQHKSSYGHSLIIAGQPGMLGAAMIAAEAALYSGCGKITVATHPSHAHMIYSSLPNVMVAPIKIAADLIPYLKEATQILVGPGLGCSAWSESILKTVCKYEKPLILDADALNILAKNGKILQHSAILTPHPGEAARLLKISTEQVENNRWSCLQKLQQKFPSAIIALKGCGTLISFPDSSEPINICPYGSPALAIPGSGDCLAGIILSLIGQQLSLEKSACTAVYLHAIAGEVAEHHFGTSGVTIQEIMPIIRILRNPSRWHKLPTAILAKLQINMLQ